MDIHPSEASIIVTLIEDILAFNAKASMSKEPTKFLFSFKLDLKDATSLAKVIVIVKIICTWFLKE